MFLITSEDLIDMCLISLCSCVWPYSALTFSCLRLYKIIIQHSILALKLKAPDPTNSCIFLALHLSSSWSSNEHKTVTCLLFPFWLSEILCHHNSSILFLTNTWIFLFWLCDEVCTCHVAFLYWMNLPSHLLYHQALPHVSFPHFQGLNP